VLRVPAITERVRATDTPRNAMRAGARNKMSSQTQAIYRVL